MFKNMSRILITGESLSSKPFVNFYSAQTIANARAAAAAASGTNSLDPLNFLYQIEMGRFLPSYLSTLNTVNLELTSKVTTGTASQVSLIIQTAVVNRGNVTPINISTNTITTNVTNISAVVIPEAQPTSNTSSNVIIPDPLVVTTLNVNVLNVYNYILVNKNLLIGSSGIQTQESDLLINVDGTYEIVFNENININANLIFTNNGEIFMYDPVLTIGLSRLFVYNTECRGFEFIWGNLYDGFFGYDVERLRFVFYPKADVIINANPYLSRGNQFIRQNVSSIYEKIMFDLDCIYTAIIHNADYNNWNSSNNLTDLIIQSTQQLYINVTKNCNITVNNDCKINISNLYNTNALNEIYNINNNYNNNNNDIVIISKNNIIINSNNINYNYNNIIINNNNYNLNFTNSSAIIGNIVPTNNSITLGNLNNYYMNCFTNNIIIGTIQIVNNDLYVNNITINNNYKLLINGITNFNNDVTIGSLQQNILSINSTNVNIIKNTNINNNFIQIYNNSGELNRIGININDINNILYELDINGQFNINGNINLNNDIIFNDDIIFISKFITITNYLSINNNTLFIDSIHSNIGICTSQGGTFLLPLVRPDRTNNIENYLFTVNGNVHISSNFILNNDLILNNNITNITINTDTILINNYLNINNDLLYIDKNNNFISLNTRGRASPCGSPEGASIRECTSHCGSPKGASIRECTFHYGSPFGTSTIINKIWIDPLLLPNSNSNITSLLTINGNVYIDNDVVLNNNILIGNSPTNIITINTDNVIMINNITINNLFYFDINNINLGINTLLPNSTIHIYNEKNYMYTNTITFLDNIQNSEQFYYNIIIPIDLLPQLLYTFNIQNNTVININIFINISDGEVCNFNIIYKKYNNNLPILIGQSDSILIKLPENLPNFPGAINSNNYINYIIDINNIYIYYTPITINTIIYFYAKIIQINI